LPLLAVAGYNGLFRTPASFDYTVVIGSVGALAPIMFFLFAAASVAPTCFCTFIASNSFATMLPRIPRTVSTLAGVTVGALLAITGVAQNLIGFFVIVGASFGPICGAIAAEAAIEGDHLPEIDLSIFDPFVTSRAPAARRIIYVEFEAGSRAAGNITSGGESDRIVVDPRKSRETRCRIKASW